MQLHLSESGQETTRVFVLSARAAAPTDGAKGSCFHPEAPTFGISPYGAGAPRIATAPARKCSFSASPATAPGERREFPTEKLGFSGVFWIWGCTQGPRGLQALVRAMGINPWHLTPHLVPLPPNSPWRSGAGTATLTTGEPEPGHTAPANNTAGKKREILQLLKQNMSAVIIFYFK